MSVATTATRYTPEDLLTMPDGDRFELVDGELVERDIGLLSSYVGGNVFSLIKNHCSANALGWAMPADCGYQCFPDEPGKVRRPDASFIRLGRLPGERAPAGHVRIAPDLAVEVLSQNDLAWDTNLKVEAYLRAGTRLVWVFDPEAKTVLIYRADGSIVGLRPHDELSGEDVLPGFRHPVSDIFLTPATAAGA